MKVGSATRLFDQKTDDAQKSLSTILKVAPVGIGVTRLRDQIIVEFNDALLDLLGYQREEVVGRRSADLMTWDNPDERDQAFSLLAAGKSIREMPTTLRRKDGTLRHARFSAMLVDLAGEAHIIGCLRDVTEQVAAEAEQAHIARRLKLSLTMMPVAVFHQDLDLRYTYITNPQIGQPTDAILGRHDNDLFNAADATFLTEIKKRVLATGVAERHEHPAELDGRNHWFDTLVEPEYDQEGHLVGIVCAGADITERKEREERYRMVVEDQTELISRYLADGSTVFANEVYCRFFGKTLAELLGQSWHPVAHPADVKLVEAQLARLSPGNPVVSVENRVIAADGNEHWMHFVNRGFFDAKGRLREIQSVGRDITARKRNEEELANLHAQLQALLSASDRVREEQRTEIAREIHDQLGATLAATNFRIEALKRQVGRESPLTDEIRHIQSLVAEASATARALCTRLRPPILDDLGLVPACRWYLGDWSANANIRVKGRFSDLQSDPADPLRTDIFRILQELLTNVGRHSGASSVSVSLSAGRRYLTLTVRDDGCGLSTQRTEGFGLLGISERARRNGGDVVIEPGRPGLVVRVRFPWQQAAGQSIVSGRK